MRDSSRITIHLWKLLWNFICRLVKERNMVCAVFSRFIAYVVDVLAFLTQGSLCFKIGFSLTLGGHELEFINATIFWIMFVLELLKADNLVIFFFNRLIFAFLNFHIWIVRNGVFWAFSLRHTTLVWRHRRVSFNRTLFNFDLLSV